MTTGATVEATRSVHQRGTDRFVVLLGGLRSQSLVTADDHTLRDDFRLIRAAIAQGVTVGSVCLLQLRRVRARSGTWRSGWGMVERSLA